MNQDDYPPPEQTHPPPGYPPPPTYPYPYRPTLYQPANGFAVASLVLGIVWTWWVGSILALIFGCIALSRMREQADHGMPVQHSKGLAVVGVVLGWVGIATFGLFLIAVSST